MNTHKDKKIILDACCGTRAMWFDKHNPNAIYMDIRREIQTKPQGHQPTIIVDPDILADFRKIPYKDKSFKLVVCDPPHFTKLGESGIFRKLYGKLSGDNWRDDLRQGFSEMWRVLEDFGVLLIKWNDYEIGFGELKKLFPAEPLFFNRKSGSANSKTAWFCFMKIPNNL